MNDDLTTKRCARCRVDKPRDEFGRERAKPDGRSAYCKRCRADVQGVRLRERLRGDPDFVARKRAIARLGRAVARGDVARPSTCPTCGCARASRDLVARFVDLGDPTTVTWTCRWCALRDAGRAVARTCLWCKEPMTVQRTHLRRGGGRYCSIKCRSAWMKATAEHVQRVPPAERRCAEDVYVDDRF